MSEPERNQAMASMAAAMNATGISVFAIMDYWTFDGFIQLRGFARAHPNVLIPSVFPGIELRIAAPTNYRLNIHVILSDELSDQDLLDFLARLQIEPNSSGSRNLSVEALKSYARALRDDQLHLHGLRREELSDDFYAWMAGSKTAEVTHESFRDALRSLPDDAAIVFQPWDTSDGLKKLDWRQHFTAAQRLFTQPDIFECKDEATRHAFMGRRTLANQGWFESFWAALGRRPRLPVRGSDAHRFSAYG